MITDSVGQENQRARDALHNTRCSACKQWEKALYPGQNAPYGKEGAIFTLLYTPLY